MDITLIMETVGKDDHRYQYRQLDAVIANSWV